MAGRTARLLGYREFGFPMKALPLVLLGALVASGGLFVTAYGGVPESPDITFRPDVLYFENNATGQKAARETTKLYGGRQKVMLVDQKPPAASPPVPISRPPPLYPFEMKQRRLNGTVTVDFIIDETGRVFDAVVVATTDSAFNDEATKAVRKWTFKPAVRNGMNIRSRLRVPISFDTR